jgi:ATP-binding cassette subfamily B multidrug efflux pump
MRELLRLTKYFKKYRSRIIIGIFALMVIDFLQLIVPRVLKAAIDALSLGRATLGNLGVYFTYIMMIAMGIAIGRFMWRYLLIGASRRIERELRTDFYNHVTTLDLCTFDIMKTGDLMAHATNDINAVRQAIGFGLVILTDICILGVASLIMMLLISPRLTLMALIPFPVIAFFSTKFGSLIHRLFEKVQEQFSVLTERVRENLSGIRVVKIFVQEEPELKRFDKLSREYVTKNLSLVRVWGIFFPVIFSLASIGEMIVLGFGGRSVILGQITIGSFVAFVAYLQTLVWPMIAIGQAINTFQRGAASQGRINRIMDMKPSIHSGPRKIGPFKGGIAFQSVSFHYPGKPEPALRDINLTIKPREFIGVTGPIGSGKTTMAGLLLRLYDFQSGKILLDGVDIREMDISEIRNNIAYVPQDTFLFSDTIRENIIFGKRSALTEDVERVARVSQIYDEIKQFPAGFDTVIGERGVTLSGGQKQRIALARALLLDRPILILDDAISAVDAETEKKILAALRDEITRRTSIVISHRLFAIQDAAKIIVIDQGRIVESGRHSELIEARGLYFDIFTRQQISMKLEEL